MTLASISDEMDCNTQGIQITEHWMNCRIAAIGLGVVAATAAGLSLLKERSND